MLISNRKLHVRWLNRATSLADVEVLRFAQIWADLIEAELKMGKSLGDVWRRCELKANSRLLSRQMLKDARLYLIQVWAYGEELKLAIGGKDG